MHFTVFYVTGTYVGLDCKTTSANEIEGSTFFENLNIKKDTLLFWKSDRFNHEQSPQVYTQNQVLQRTDK